MIELGRLDHGYAIAEAAGCLLNAEYDIILSHSKEGQLLGGVILHHYTQRSISMHMAGWSKFWMSRDMVWVVFDYVFKQLRCENLFCEVRSGNNTVIELARRMGFKYEVTVSEVFPEDDLVVMRMRASDCQRWLSIKSRNLTSKGKVH